MVGLYFALRSGSEHRRLYYSPPQIQLIEKPISELSRGHFKNQSSRLMSKSKKPKEVVHYANTSNPKRCFVHIFKTYVSRCPVDRPANAFYLQPLSKTKGNIWYSKTPCGHNTLQRVDPE